ncbi:MAG: tRNA pseudouridine(55) synthase TruB [Alicyclobacillus sp.]|nr:tRNA pseudouridine(55) synthase TruB [Alicyclobacillus sp.]
MYSGILVVDKPAGVTSHDVVGQVRRVYGTRRVGHAGTLDPDATGVLVVCVGIATRVVEYLSADDKVYEGEVVFGIGTDTDDASGQVTEMADARHLTRGQISEAALRLVGRLEQRPPRYSAVHVAGQRAYDLARRGTAFELPTRTVEVYDLEVDDVRAADGTPSAQFRVHCSKGTYIRSLCRDWGGLLGVPAHLANLRRIRAGRFTIEQAVQLDALAKDDAPGRWLLPVSAGLNLPVLVVAEEEAERLAHGQRLRGQGGAFSNGSIALAQTPVGDAVAVIECVDATSGWWQPRKVFWKRDSGWN